jgi:predicted DNA-binding protein
MDNSLLGRGNTMEEKVRTTTIRIPYDMWKRLRRLQEDEKIKSIQQACIEGLEYIIKDKG